MTSVGDLEFCFSYACAFVAGRTRRIIQTPPGRARERAG